MARHPTGTVVEKTTTRGTSYAVRFRALGARQFVHLGYEADGWTRAKAEDELVVVMAQVRRGAWRPPEPAPVVEIKPDPTFHEFASEWLTSRKGELRPSSYADYEWQLACHLLPFFARHRLSQITVQEVDRYRQAKVREAELSVTSINKTLTRLAQILEVAVEYELIGRNPAKGRRRRLKATRPRPVHLDSAEQVQALLDAARALDADPESKTAGRHALVATLAFAGLRVGEACALQWRDVDLAAGRLTVGRAKTDAGMREVDLRPALREILAEHKATARRAGHDDLVFPTAARTRRTKDNARQRVIVPVVARADELLAERGQQPLPAGVTAHKLRHTFASILAALNEPMPYVMQQLGHADPKFTLRVYAHAMRRGDDERERCGRSSRACLWDRTTSIVRLLPSGGRRPRTARRRLVRAATVYPHARHNHTGSGVDSRPARPGDLQPS
jgi:integrase